MIEVPPFRVVVIWHAIFLVLAMVSMAIYCQTIDPRKFRPTSVTSAKGAVAAQGQAGDVGHAILNTAAAAWGWKDNFSEKFN